MSTEKLDSATLLSTLDEKMLALQKLRDAVMGAIAVGALSPAGDMDIVLSSPGSRDTVAVTTDLPQGAFRNKSVPACIELYLSTVGMKKKTNKEIVDALTEGGVETTSDSLQNTVASALFKLKSVGTVLRFKDGWGLASNYPAHIRGTGTAPAKASPAKKYSAKKKPQKKAAPTQGKGYASITGAEKLKAKTTTVAPAEARPPAQGSAQARIVSLLNSKPDSEFSTEDVLRALPEIKRNVVQLILGRLTDERRKIAERTASGNYRIIIPNGHQAATASN